MGGHGALICALKNPGLYKSVTAFAPVCNPGRCKWGRRVLEGYMGADVKEDNWAEWDATELVKKYNGPPLEIFIDQVLDTHSRSKAYFFPLLHSWITLASIFGVLSKPEPNTTFPNFELCCNKSPNLTFLLNTRVVLVFAIKMVFFLFSSDFFFYFSALIPVLVDSFRKLSL